MSPTIPSALSAQDLNRRLEAHRQTVAVTTQCIGLGEVDSMASRLGPKDNQKLWDIDAATGNIKRGDGLFFQVQGLRVMPHGPSAPLRFSQPVLREAPPAGTVVLVHDKQTGDVLLDMKTEAGADPARRHTTFSATLQISSSCLQQQEVDDSTLAARSLLGVLMGLGLRERVPVQTQEDGGRFFNKRNDLHVLHVESKEALAHVQQTSLVWTQPAFVAHPLNRNEANAFFWQSMGRWSLDRFAGA